jgi:hypothetical protein
MNTPDVAQRSVQPFVASRARRFNIARGVAAAAAACVILIGTAASDRLLAVFWLFGWLLDSCCSVAASALRQRSAIYFCSGMRA